jgi:HEAT repeat protein
VPEADGLEPSAEVEQVAEAQVSEAQAPGAQEPESQEPAESEAAPAPEAAPTEERSRWSWRRPKAVAKDAPGSAAQQHPSHLAAVPRRESRPEALQAPVGSTAEQWLASLGLVDRSQRVQLRSAVDDLLHGSEVARASAARTLVALGLSAEPILVDCARSTNPTVAETCLECLFRVGSQKLAQLLPQITSAQDHALRLVALRVAQHLDDAARRPLLVSALRDPHPSVRRRALTYLAWERGAWGKAEILRLCYDADPTVKWAALEALAAVQPEEARKRLDSMFPGMDAALRRHAVRLLERQQKPVEPNLEALHWSERAEVPDSG